MSVESDPRLVFTALPGLPTVSAGHDLASLAEAGLVAAKLEPQNCDVLIVTSKIVSRAEGRFFDLSRIDVSEPARSLAEEVGKDPPLVELILRESEKVSRKADNALIMRHRLGFVCANAGIDSSNARPADAPEGSGPWALCLPVNPDASAAALRNALRSRLGVEMAVVISDSFGRPFRTGTVGVAIGVAGLPALDDRRGQQDRYGATLQHTLTAPADQLAAASDLVAGQGSEGRPMVHVRGLHFAPSDAGASVLHRAPDEDLYA